jgi:hypothetical protein
LPNKACEWKWSDHEAAAFNDLKQALMEAPVLKFFNPNKPIFSDCDASNYAIKAVLIQPGDDDLEHLVAYFYRWLSKAECNYFEDGELEDGMTEASMWTCFSRFPCAEEVLERMGCVKMEGGILKRVFY